MVISPFLDEISFWNFARHSWDIGSLVFTLLCCAYILTFEFLCAGLNLETSGLVAFWYSGGQLLRPLVLFSLTKIFLVLWTKVLYQSYFSQCVFPQEFFESNKIIPPPSLTTTSLSYYSSLLWTFQPYTCKKELVSPHKNTDPQFKFKLCQP